MRIVNIREARTQRYRLVGQVTQGEPFIRARAGKPPVKVVPIDAPVRGQVRRTGFLRGQFVFPDDVDAMDAAGIQRMFEDRDANPQR